MARLESRTTRGWPRSAFSSPVLPYDTHARGVLSGLSPAASAMDHRPLLDHEADASWCCLDGQSLTEEALQQHAPGGVLRQKEAATATAWLYDHLIAQRPRLVGILLPAVLVHLAWWSYVLPRHDLSLFTAVHGGPAAPAEGSGAGGSDIAGYWMSITMVFGSLVAGATSVGGAAVAFPVMTLVFDISPTVARDFALMIQTVGMLSAAFAIWYQRILVDWPCIFWCTLGGMLSTPAGLTALHFAGGLPPPIAKTIFLSSWLAFAVALALLNFQRGRQTHRVTPYPQGPADIRWKSRVYLVAGLLGGLLTVVSGSGMDLAAFAVQVSVPLHAVNSWQRTPARVSGGSAPPSLRCSQHGRSHLHHPSSRSRFHI